jgi:cytidylate kinase
MSDTISVEKCRSYLDIQLQGHRTAKAPAGAAKAAPTVTMSREAGAGGLPIAEQLVEYLQRHWPGPAGPWTVFHRNLVQKVIDDHKLSERLIEYMPEDKVSAIEDALQELFGLHPPAETLVQRVTETILRLAELGNTIIVGRAANVITAHMPNTFHIRLVGSLEVRVKRVQEHFQFSPAQAAARVREEDTARRRYVKKYFKKDIDDPLLYHLILNTDDFTYEQATDIIGHALIRKLA